jgi:hypothetical protein
MKSKRNRERVDHSGSTFDSFLEEVGIREDVEAAAIKRVLAWQLEQACGRRNYDYSRKRRLSAQSRAHQRK